MAVFHQAVGAGGVLDNTVKLGWTSVPCVRELSWLYGDFGWKTVTRDQLDRKGQLGLG